MAHAHTPDRKRHGKQGSMHADEHCVYEGGTHDGRAQPPPQGHTTRGRTNHDLRPNGFDLCVQLLGFCTLGDDAGLQRR